ncbi:MAG TPA: hypothetical protein VGQ46_04110 [Thermoanaerobaculia bacterium]|jgi:hypothetical protein|nr:hypothetical protein [Thermoanaerobaculia bacterium]
MRRRVSLVVALLAFASFARAESLRVVAPANGATLRGGSFAELRWTCAGLPPASEEWEAFLSVDGGKYYAFRVTPHLDINLRSFTFLVPNVDTSNARILIRTGDEVHELHFESRDSFSIVRDAKAEQPLPLVLHSSGGEAAREGDPAVLAWADGARDGSGVTRQSSTPVPYPLFDHSKIVITQTFSAVPPGAYLFGNPIPPSRMHFTGRATRIRKAEPLPAVIDLLLAGRRRNV